MSKKVIKIQSTGLGADITSLDIYHTSVTGSNFIQTATTAELTGSGVTLAVDDNIIKFIGVVNDGGECQLTSGSLTSSLWKSYVRYFTASVSASSFGGTVEVTSPISVAATTSSISQSVDFNIYSTFIIQADASPGYPDISGFDGWYDAETSGNLISTDNPLTVTNTTFTGSDSFWAYFS